MKADSAIDWTRIRATATRAIVFIPPLIGGHYVQQARHFRRMIRSGYDFVSFNYSGHGASAGKFSLEAAFQDTAAVLNKAAAMAHREKLPLFGVGVCYPAIPLLACAARSEGSINKIVLVNAVMGVSARAVIRSFFDYYSQLCRSERRIPRIAEALGRYADFVFPGIDKNRHRFGTLQRRRTRVLKTLMDAVLTDPLADVHLSRTPALCLYSAHDRVLRIAESRFDDRYEQDVQRVCPQVIFQRLSGDHFLSHPDARYAAFKKILAFLQKP